MQLYQQTYQLPPSISAENISAIIERVRRKIKPRAFLNPADWADQYYIIAEGSAKGQRWKTEDVEYTREILNAVADPAVEEITVMTSSQILKTTIGLIIVSYFIEYDPSPMLLLLPTIQAGEQYSKTKLEPTLYQIDSIKERLERKSRDGKNTVLFKEIMPGIFLIIAGANSPVGLAANSVRVVIEDDIDRIPVSAGDEGDPCFLAEQRIESYRLHGSKIIRFSTPTNSGKSRIEAQYKLGTREKFYVPCPHCGYMQVLRFFPKYDEVSKQFYGGLIWDKDTDLMGKTTAHYPKTARYRCEDCRKDIDHLSKALMRKSGKWVVDNPKANKHRSFGAIGRLYTSLSTWEQMVDEWLKAKADPELTKVFYNTVLGEVYEEDTSQKIDQETVMAYTEHYLTDKDPDLPNEILFLTTAVDTHPDRLELSTEGWGIGEENWLVHYEQIWGDTDKDEVYEKLNEYLERKWKRKDGVELILGGYKDNRRYYACLFDSGGYMKNTQSVYDYTRARQHLGVIAIKGRAGNGFPILLNQSLVGKYRDTILQNLGVDTIKEHVWQRLRYKPGGPKTIHYTSAFCDFRYFEGLFSEPPNTIYNSRTNTLVVIWKKKRGARNEPWDLKVFFYGAMKLASPNFEEIKELYDTVTLSYSEHSRTTPRINQNLKSYNGWQKKI